METASSPSLILHPLPESALGGIDLLAFTTTPRFRGVKNLPPGWHFAFVGTSTAFSERHGLWFDVASSSQPPACIVAKWDAEHETLVLEIDDSEVLRWRANLGSVWREGLMPYRQSAGGGGEEEVVEGDWPVLTSAINDALLTRILGVDADHRVSSASSSHRDLEAIPGLAAADINLATEQELHFLPIDLKRTWREGATGRERTDAAQDRSWALENLIASHCQKGNAQEVIGEMQFCFIMVLTINNFSCLEQWKRILTLLFTCKTVVAAKPDLFVSAIAALRLQLQHCKDAEGGLIDLADESGSLLKSLLARFRKGVEALGSLAQGGFALQDVVDELDDLESWLEQEHGWQFGGSFAKTGVLELEDGERVDMDTREFDEEDETGEFAPVVVELTGSQREMLDLPGTTGAGGRVLETRLRDGVEESEGSDGDEEGGIHSSEESEAGDLDEMDARY